MLHGDLLYVFLIKLFEFFCYLLDHNINVIVCTSFCTDYPRQDEEIFGSMPVWFDADTCTQPANSAEFQTADLSLCAESLYSNVPAFYRFEDEVPIPFDLLTACNGGDLFQDLFIELP